MPAPNDVRANDPNYSFEQVVRFDHLDGTTHWGFIDCYRRGCFVLEMKQSRKRLSSSSNVRQMDQGWSNSTKRRLENAQTQAEAYARALDEWPPFLINVDIGGVIELRSDFKRMGKTYAHFPDQETYRIQLDDLRDPEVRRRLAAVWMDPMSLDPSKQIREATAEVARILGRFVRSVRERAPRDPDGQVDAVVRAGWDKEVAIFAMQCLFAMFSDSVGLLPDRCFSALLKRYRDDGVAQQLHLTLTHLFGEMDRGGFSAVFGRRIEQFNGSLYKINAVKPITPAELEMLCDAAECDWSSVEPAKFGELMEMALAPGERKELGAHYTPANLVELMVEATVIEVLRKDWEAVKSNADVYEKSGKIRESRKIVQAFHDALCEVKVLDPACGTGNFLYIAMHRMKELEGEVIKRLTDLGVRDYVMEMDGSSVGPAQFMGIEKNYYAVWIAKMVMWIGHLQWHYRLWGRVQSSTPILREYDAISHCDAILDASNQVGAPGTAEGVRCVKAGVPAWPKAHFIIGNPPFIAGKDMRQTLGKVYAEALWASRGGRFRSADIVTVWWDRAAEILAADSGKPGPFRQVLKQEKKNGVKKRSGPTPIALQRFGFITTNSITQNFSRRVIEERLCGSPPIRLTFAIPDHPWHLEARHASVRVAMTVAEAGAPDGRGRLVQIIKNTQAGADGSGFSYAETRGDIGADLSIGRGVDRTSPLKANAGLACRGVQLLGDGFLVDEAKAVALAALSRDGAPPPVRAYRNGKDLTDQSRGLLAIDLFGWSEDDAQWRHPGFMQHLRQTVKPARDRNNRSAYRDVWWAPGEPRPDLRAALEGLTQYIVTVETSKHRWFRFLDASILPDNRLVCIASDAPFVLGVLSSRLHRIWALASGGLLEDRPIYAKSVCFDHFPFPAVSALTQCEIATTAQRIEDHRDHVLSCNPALTMTKLYNVLEKVAAEAELSETENEIRLSGCVDTLLSLHTQLDQQVFDAYGWPLDMSDAEVTARLVELNRVRAVEEGEGRILFLRPAYQQPRQKPLRNSLRVSKTASAVQARSLPGDDLGIIVEVLEVLKLAGKPMSLAEVMNCFELPARQATAKNKLKRALNMLAAAESIYVTDAGWFAPRRVLH